MTDKEVTNYLAGALVTLQRGYPKLSAEQVLRALEAIRFRVTEDLLRVRMK